MTVGKFYATFLIQDYFRRFKKKKEIKVGVPGIKMATLKNVIPQLNLEVKDKTE